VGQARQACPERSRRGRPSRAKLGSECHRPGLRRRLPRRPNKNMGSRNHPDPDRVQSKKSDFPPRSNPRPYIDEHQCVLRPSRTIRKLKRRCSNPARSRAIRIDPPNRSQAGRTPRPPRAPHQQSSAGDRPTTHAEFHMEIDHADPPKLKPHPRRGNPRTIKESATPFAHVGNQESNSGIMLSRSQNELFDGVAIGLRSGK